jgi:hypothetical protein
LVITTLALGTPPPLGSVTVPERVPPATWAWAAVEKTMLNMKIIAAKQPDQCLTEPVLIVKGLTPQLGGA